MNVTGGASPYSYSWTGVGGFTATSQNITNLALGDYTVVVTDHDQCITTVQDMTIKTGTPPSVGLWSKSNAGCAGNDGVINSYMIGGYNGGAIPTQYQLSGRMSRPYQNSGVFSGLIPGDYTITVKDSKGCTASSSTIVIAQSPLLSFTSNSRNVNVSACGNGSDGSSYIEISGGVAPYQYILNGVEQKTTSATSYTFTGLQPNISNSLTVTDSKGCSISKNIILTKDPMPVAQIAYRGNVSCSGGNDGFLSFATSYGGVGVYMYSINGGVSYQSKNVFYNLTVGTYNAVVKDTKACVSIPVPVVITQVDPIVIKSNSSTASVSACGGGNDGTITPVVTGGRRHTIIALMVLKNKLLLLNIMFLPGLALMLHII